ncbi:hypothetical protein D3C73_1386870 [compost metagenome]
MLQNPRLGLLFKHRLQLGRRSRKQNIKLSVLGDGIANRKSGLVRQRSPTVNSKSLPAVVFRHRNAASLEKPVDIVHSHPVDMKRSSKHRSHGVFGQIILSRT